MNHQRQLDRTSQTHMPAEHFTLQLSGRIVIMIVEPNFSPANHARALLDEVEELLFRGRIKESGIVWMHTHGCIDSFVPFSQIDRSLKCPTVRIAGADVQHCIDTSIAGACDYFFALGIVLNPRGVAM